MRHKPVAKMSRRLGIPLTPKAGRILERRPSLQTGGRGSRRPGSPYKERLIEKQRLRFQYNVSEKQLQAAFKKALTSDEPTGYALVEDLETRLDAIVMRAGFARTIYQARQYVSHGHVLVDGKRVDRPGYRVAVGNTVSISPKSQQTEPFQRVKEFPEVETPPTYLEVNLPALSVVLASRPSRPLIPIICNEQLVVEYYAR